MTEDENGSIGVRLAGLNKKREISFDDYVPIEIWPIMSANLSPPNRLPKTA